MRIRNPRTVTTFQDLDMMAPTQNALQTSGDSNANTNPLMHTVDLLSHKEAIDNAARYRSRSSQL